jgi:hypothetical protein
MACPGQVSLFIELVVSVMLFVGMFWLTWGREEPLELEALLLKARIWEALKVIDVGGTLRYHALRNDSVAIEAELDRFLAGLNYQVILCREVCNVSLPYPRVVGISYLIAGDWGNFTPIEIVVNSWLT